MPVCTTTGPGADIDAVDLRHGASTTVTGVGLKGSAMLTAQTGATACTTCGASAGACPNSGMDAADRVTGIRDGMSYAGNTPDTGYLSLNGGTVWLQIGSANGMGSAQDIVSGDTLTVYEVDKYYIDLGLAPASCACAPEKYTVWAYVDPTDQVNKVQLIPTKYQAKNTECGTTPSGNLGCGTTDFMVP
jgi:hypothetical protein